MASRIRQRDFPFTVILPREEVFAKVSLAQAEDLDKAEAVEIGRELDADLVIRGRVTPCRPSRTATPGRAPCTGRWPSGTPRAGASTDTSRCRSR